MTLFAAVLETDEKMSPTCARCGKPAAGWSGVEAWRDDLGRWVGWCGNACRNAWLDGDRPAVHQPHADRGSE